MLSQIRDFSRSVNCLGVHAVLKGKSMKRFCLLPLLVLFVACGDKSNGKLDQKEGSANHSEAIQEFDLEHEPKAVSFDKHSDN